HAGKLLHRRGRYLSSWAGRGARTRPLRSGGELPCRERRLRSRPKQGRLLPHLEPQGILEAPRMNEPASLSPPAGLEFSGERYVPSQPGEIAYEHWHRYAFASLYAAGKVVLDVASGEGYGASLLAQTASRVHGADISPEAVSHARESYGRDN